MVMLAVLWDLGSPPGIYNPKNGTLPTNQDKTRGTYNFCFEAGLRCSSSAYSSSPLPLASSWSASAAGDLLLAVVPLEGISFVVGRRRRMRRASSADNIVVPNANHHWG